MNEQSIKEFWNENSCGESQVGGFKGDYEEFFDKYDNYRYSKEKHILKCLDKIDFDGKKVLEIGLGQGADSEQIIRRGGIWSGLDLTETAVERVKQRLPLKQLPYQDIKQGSALEIPYPDNSFDIVYSFGVLHHIPEIEKARAEIARVLKPGGRLVMMLYAKNSLNYLFSISIIRRLGIFLLSVLNIKCKNEIYNQHIENAKKIGLFNYLKMKNFIHRNTDGPLNPYSKVYDRYSVEQDFKDFKLKEIHKEFMHAPPLPVQNLPCASLLGWHLWVEMDVLK